MQTETLKVTGMTCGGCTSKVAHALNAITGVHDVVVSLEDGQAAVLYDERLTASSRLQLAVEAAGYGVNTTNTIQKSQVKGGCCS